MDAIVRAPCMNSCVASLGRVPQGIHTLRRAQMEARAGGLRRGRPSKLVVAYAADPLVGAAAATDAPSKTEDEVGGSDSFDNLGSRTSPEAAAGTAATVQRVVRKRRSKGSWSIGAPEANMTVEPLVEPVAVASTSGKKQQPAGSPIVKGLLEAEQNGGKKIAEIVREKFRERRERSLNRVASRFRGPGAISSAGGGNRATAAAAAGADLKGALVMNNSIDASALVENELVVHKRFGIARFKGIVRQHAPAAAALTAPSDGAAGEGGVPAPVPAAAAKDYVLLEFSDGPAKLQLSAAQRLLYRYKTPGEQGSKEPKLNAMGDPKTWARRKAKGMLSIQGLVSNLMDTYLERVMISRPTYPLLTPEAEARITSGFKHALTADQQAAVDDVGEDMSRETPMDRLVVGDVGFGKTEVAVRAIFRAVGDKRQVLLLTPTTVLARQHALLLTARFAPFGVSVGFLTRFTATAERARIVAGLADGSVHVVVGTHALLSDAAHCCRLGLLIIDEEQRFGVKHKDAISGLKSTVDVLTMSATPIPRTLHMALAGFRDASIIATPPPGRRPIATDLRQFDEQVVKAAIEKELARDGQVFYVVPRISAMPERMADLQRLLPGVRIQLAHGQMRATELEEAMELFSEGQADVLLCTTIVESGLDMPRVNTIVVEDVNMFGLASLYQLRGRVGRNDLQAYALLLYDPNVKLEGGASERLAAIRDCCGLGEGFRLAERDMAIRGVGSIFGERQSGDLANVGTDLYLEMLYEQLASVESCRLPGVEWSAVDLSALQLVCGVPPAAAKTPSERDRILAECALAGREGPAALRELRTKLEDRVGSPLPDALYWLLRSHLLRWYASEMGVERISVGPPGSLYLHSAMREEAFNLLEMKLPPSLQTALRWEGAQGRILVRQVVSAVDEPIWAASGGMHLERAIQFLSAMHAVMPKFLKFV